MDSNTVKQKENEALANGKGRETSGENSSQNRLTGDPKQSAVAGMNSFGKALSVIVRFVLELQLNINLLLAFF